MKEKNQNFGIYSLVFIGIAYLIFIRITGVGIPCLFYKITGMMCPGCGMTRAIVAISRGEFKEAFMYNALCLTAFPILVLYLLFRHFRCLKCDYTSFKIWEYPFLAIMALIIVTYGILRN